MRIIRTNILLLAVFFVLFSSKTVSGLNEKTHEAINTRVAKTTLPNGFTLNDYLINHLGFTNGINEEFNNEEVTRWLALGGRYEDKPPLGINPLTWIPKLPLRSLNHFHDPLTNMGYNVNGETNLLMIVEGWTNIPAWSLPPALAITDVKSSITWALLPEDGQYLGDYSWNDVMGYYKEALTNEDQDTRNTNFKETFRGLGQLMHHVQDASSPAHTRNDQHWSQDPMYNYEAWVRDNKSTDVDISSYTPVFFIGDMDSYSGQADSMASFIDTNKYFGTNPDDTATNTVGLSEYTNANFFSEQTNAFESTTYTYPQVPDDLMSDPTNIEEKEFINEYADTYPREYYKKDCLGEANCSQGYYLLSAVDYLEYYRKSLNPLGRKKLTVPLLDDNVYSDYADLLLPRAIGYSAGLLEYFFRGEMDFKINHSTPSITITNNSTEDMNGSFTLYYDATDGTRTQIDNGKENKEWELEILAGKTSNELTIINANNLADQQYILVFKGTLGSQEGAVVGKAVKPWEPWGETVCDNNPWGAQILLGYEDYTYFGCPDLSDIVREGTGPVGEAWALNEGTLHHVLTGDSMLLDETGYYNIHFTSSDLFVAYQNIEATMLRIKINTDVYPLEYSPDLPDSGSSVMLLLYGVNGTRAYIFLDTNFEPYSTGHYYILDDNGGEEQILNLSDYGFINENIEQFTFYVYAAYQEQVSYSLDYIDFYTE